VILSARGVAALGWAVFPVESRGKKPLIKNWPNLATTVQATVKDWWTRWPDANIGVVTGAKSGILVLDIDGDKGWVSLGELERMHGWALPPTLVVSTGRGAHLYFKHPGGHIGNGANIHGLAGLDIRGDGGYVVGPGSLHSSGARYEIVVRPACPLRVLRELVEALPTAPDVLCFGRKDANMTTERTDKPTVGPIVDALWGES